jgi:hypothetical protein
MASAPPPRALAPLATLAAAIATVALSACGGTAAGSPNASSSSSDEAKAEQFAKCMREHGIEAQVAKPGGGGFGLKVTGKAGAGGGPQRFEAAQKACARYRPGGPRVKLSPAQEAEQRDQVFRFAKCMREHGIDVGTPETSGGAVRIHIQGQLDPESPKFQSAQRACQGLNPKGPLPGTATHSGSGGHEGATLGIGP